MNVYKYKKNGLLLIIPAFIVLVFAGCKKENCFKSTGKIVTEERQLEDFGKIELSDYINLFITQDTVNRILVEAGENLISAVVTEVNDGVLVIKNNNMCNWMRSYKKQINVYLFCRNLFMINYNGAGDVKSMNTIVSDSVELNFWSGAGQISLDVQCRIVRIHMHTGVGDAEVSGTTQYLSCFYRGNGQVRCTNLQASDAYIDSKGTNDCYINTTGHLSARIGYIGNVYYSGQPSSIESEITERGRLIPLE